MNTNNFLLNKYGPGLPKIVPGMVRQNIYELFAELGFTVGCEVGVEKGKNAQTMFKCIPNLKLYAVDPFKEHPGSYSHATTTSSRHWNNSYMQVCRGQAQKRMQGRNAVIIEKFSEEAVQDIPYDSLDFVYIDGDHTYDYAMVDIILWSRRVRQGGIISGHDYGVPDELKLKYDVNVARAVDDYVYAHKIDNWYLTDITGKRNNDSGCQSWFFVKKRYLQVLKSCRKL